MQSERKDLQCGVDEGRLISLGAWPIRERPSRDAGLCRASVRATPDPKSQYGVYCTVWGFAFGLIARIFQDRPISYCRGGEKSFSFTAAFGTGTVAKKANFQRAGPIIGGQKSRKTRGATESFGEGLERLAGEFLSCGNARFENLVASRHA
jgi:hypothetical protein